MLIDDKALHSVFETWEAGTWATLGASRGHDGLIERIRQILVELKGDDAGSETSAVDLTALIRQWLLRYANGGPSWLRVPRESGWPDASEWRRAMFEVVESTEALDVRPQWPRLAWLGAQSDLMDDTFCEMQARHRELLRMEPFVARLVGLTHYTGEGQREAVRALLQMPADVTLIANLPTGSGKSILAQIPPLLMGEGYLSVVVLPTIALAMDQEERMNALFRRLSPAWQDVPLAYHGSLDPEARSTIRRALKEGRQRILFAGPEAVTGSLRQLLVESASAGRLSHVVVDEAHLVASWGTGFRPAFQLLPAMVHALRACAPTDRTVRVVLASATLTQHTVEVLQHQFGPPQKTQLISAVHLRPEPRYASVQCASEEQRSARVAEALRLAPRPFILYVTKPEQAETWLESLRGQGFARIAQFTGQTPGHIRKELLDAWKNNELDGMVATSAFGLGVDKDDVRTIVHATLPESLDRFYQEVGRAGRDGKACVSLLAFTLQDVGMARDMSGHVFIGNELGFQRWEAMRASARPVAGRPGESYVALDALRPELQVRGLSNKQWNLRTLNLMATAGIIELTELTTQIPQAQAQEAAPGEEGVEKDLRFASIRIVNPHHSSQSVFERELNLARDDYANSSEYGFDLLMAIAFGQKSVQSGLSDLYRLGGANWSPVESLCGGCAADWTTRPRSALSVRPLATRSTHFGRAERAPWPAHFTKAGPALAFVMLDDVARALVEGPVLRGLLGLIHPHSILLPTGAPAELTEMVYAVLAERQDAVFLERPRQTHPLDLEGADDEVRILLWPFSGISAQCYGALWAARAAFTVVVLGRSVPDPERPDRRVCDAVPWIDAKLLERELLA